MKQNPTEPTPQVPLAQAPPPPTMTPPTTPTPTTVFAGNLDPPPAPPLSEFANKFSPAVGGDAPVPGNANDDDNTSTDTYSSSDSEDVVFREQQVAPPSPEFSSGTEHVPPVDPLKDVNPRDWPKFLAGHVGSQVTNKRKVVFLTYSREQLKTIPIPVNNPETDKLFSALAANDISEFVQPPTPRAAPGSDQIHISFADSGTLGRRFGSREAKILCDLAAGLNQMSSFTGENLYITRIKPSAASSTNADLPQLPQHIASTDPACDIDGTPWVNIGPPGGVGELLTLAGPSYDVRRTPTGVESPKTHPVADVVAMGARLREASLPTDRQKSRGLAHCHMLQYLTCTVEEGGVRRVDKSLIPKLGAETVWFEPCYGFGAARFLHKNLSWTDLVDGIANGSYTLAKQLDRYVQCLIRECGNSPKNRCVRGNFGQALPFSSTGFTLISGVAAAVNQQFRDKLKYDFNEQHVIAFLVTQQSSRRAMRNEHRPKCIFLKICWKDQSAIPVKFNEETNIYVPVPGTEILFPAYKRPPFVRDPQSLRSCSIDNANGVFTFERLMMGQSGIRCPDDPFDVQTTGYLAVRSFSNWDPAVGLDHHQLFWRLESWLVDNACGALFLLCCSSQLPELFKNGMHSVGADTIYVCLFPPIDPRSRFHCRWNGYDQNVFITLNSKLLDDQRYTTFDPCGGCYLTDFLDISKYADQVTLFKRPVSLSPTYKAPVSNCPTIPANQKDRIAVPTKVLFSARFKNRPVVGVHLESMEQVIKAELHTGGQSFNQANPVNWRNRVFTCAQCRQVNNNGWLYCLACFRAVVYCLYEHSAWCTPGMQHIIQTISTSSVANEFIQTYRFEDVLRHQVYGGNVEKRSLFAAVRNKVRTMADWTIKWVTGVASDTAEKGCVEFEPRTQDGMVPWYRGINLHAAWKFSLDKSHWPPVEDCRLNSAQKWLGSYLLTVVEQACERNDYKNSKGLTLRITDLPLAWMDNITQRFFLELFGDVPVTRDLDRLRLVNPSSLYRESRRAAEGLKLLREMEIYPSGDARFPISSRRIPKGILDRAVPALADQAIEMLCRRRDAERAARLAGLPPAPSSAVPGTLALRELGDSNAPQNVRDLFRIEAQETRLTPGTTPIRQELSLVPYTAHPTPKLLARRLEPQDMPNYWSTGGWEDRRHDDDERWRSDRGRSRDRHWDDWSSHRWEDERDTSHHHWSDSDWQERRPRSRERSPHTRSWNWSDHSWTSAWTAASSWAGSRWGANAQSTEEPTFVNPSMVECVVSNTFTILIQLKAAVEDLPNRTVPFYFMVGMLSLCILLCCVRLYFMYKHWKTHAPLQKRIYMLRYRSNPHDVSYIDQSVNSQEILLEGAEPVAADILCYASRSVSGRTPINRPPPLAHLFAHCGELTSPYCFTVSPEIARLLRWCAMCAPGGIDGSMDPNYLPIGAVRGTVENVVIVNRNAPQPFAPVPQATGRFPYESQGGPRARPPPANTPLPGDPTSVNFHRAHPQTWNSPVGALQLRATDIEAFTGRHAHRGYPTTTHGLPDVTSTLPPFALRNINSGGEQIARELVFDSLRFQRAWRQAYHFTTHQAERWPGGEADTFVLRQELRQVLRNLLSEEGDDPEAARALSGLWPMYAVPSISAYVQWLRLREVALTAISNVATESDYSLTLREFTRRLAAPAMYATDQLTEGYMATTAGPRGRSHQHPFHWRMFHLFDYAPRVAADLFLAARRTQVLDGFHDPGHGLDVHRESTPSRSTMAPVGTSPAQSSSSDSGSIDSHSSFEGLLRAT